MITKGKSGRGGARSPCVREGWRLRAPTRRAPLRARGGGGEPRAGGFSPGSGQCVHFLAGCVQFWPGYGRMCSVFSAMCSLPGIAEGGIEAGAQEAGTHKGRRCALAAAGASRGPAGVNPGRGNVSTFGLDVSSFRRHVFTKWPNVSSFAGDVSTAWERGGRGRRKRATTRGSGIGYPQGVPLPDTTDARSGRGYPQGALGPGTHKGTGTGYPQGAPLRRLGHSVNVPVNVDGAGGSGTVPP